MKTLRTIGVAGLIAVATFGWYLGVKSISQTAQRHEEATRYIAMQDYVPVGNGGALAEMSGRISSERKKMYQQINDTYFLNINCIAPRKVIEKADRLKNPNLTEKEREEINSNIGDIERNFRL